MCGGLTMHVHTIYCDLTNAHDKHFSSTQLI
jgi:hypothetical protein